MGVRNSWEKSLTKLARIISVPDSSSAAALKLRANSSTSRMEKRPRFLMRTSKLPRASSFTAAVISSRGRVSV